MPVGPLGVACSPRVCVWRRWLTLRCTRREQAVENCVFMSKGQVCVQTFWLQQRFWIFFCFNQLCIIKLVSWIKFCVCRRWWWACESARAGRRCVWMWLLPYFHWKIHYHHYLGWPRHSPQVRALIYLHLSGVDPFVFPKIFRSFDDIKRIVQDVKMFPSER